MDKPESYKGYTITALRAGGKGGYRALAVLDAEEERSFRTVIFIGPGAKARAVADVKHYIDSLPVA